MATKTEGEGHRIVIVTDATNIIPFRQRRGQSLHEKEVAHEGFRDFIVQLESHFGDRMEYLGEENDLERFLFTKGGMVEILLESPLTIKAYFVKRGRADRFLHAMQGTLRAVIPDSPVKHLFIEGLQVEEDRKDPFSMDKWKHIHTLYLEKSLVISLITVFIFAIIQLVKVMFSVVLGVHSTVVEILIALIIAFLFQPVFHKTESVIQERFFR